MKQKAKMSTNRSHSGLNPTRNPFQYQTRQRTSYRCFAVMATLTASLLASLLPGFTPIAKAELIEQLSTLPTFIDVALSPDGAKMATIVQREGRLGVLVQETQSRDVLAWLEPTRFEAAGIDWVNNERIIIDIGRRVSYAEQLTSYGELYAVNYDGTRGDFLFGIRSADSRQGSRTRTREGQRAWGQLIDPLPKDPKYMLVSAEPMSKDGSEIPNVVRVNVKNGRLKELIRSPIQQPYFLTDNLGEVRVVVGTDLENDRRAFHRKSDSWEWIEITQFKVEDNFEPLSVNGDEFFFLARLKDKRGYHKLNLTTGKVKTLYQPNHVDVSGALTSASRDNVLALRIDPDYTSYLITNKSHPEAKRFRSLLDQFSGLQLDVVSSSLDGNTAIYYVSSDVYSGIYYLWQDEKMTFLFKRYPELDDSKLLGVEPFKLQSRDGETVNGYLTKATQGPGPTVMLIHGGPHGIRDRWSFNNEVQMLATQGFNVIQVNFRGSGGYGEAFAQLGYREWGRGIQHDIIDTTKWAIQQKIADRSKICIMGGSFGAYSAMQSATLEPDMYQCVVASAGIYDLPMLYTKGDIKDVYSGKGYLDRVIGNDRSQLASYSPVNHVNKLKAKLLIVHGVADQRAPIQHARALMSALDKNGIPYESQIEEGEGHGLLSLENRMEYFQTVSEFIRSAIGAN